MKNIPKPLRIGACVVVGLMFITLFSTLKNAYTLSALLENGTQSSAKELTVPGHDGKEIGEVIAEMKTTIEKIEVTLDSIQATMATKQDIKDTYKIMESRKGKWR